MYTDIMVGIVAVGVVVINLLLLLMVYLGVAISNKLDDVVNHMHGGFGKTPVEKKEEVAKK
jgi:hypothetical protein